MTISWGSLGYSRVIWVGYRVSQWYKAVNRKLKSSSLELMFAYTTYCFSSYFSSCSSTFLSLVTSCVLDIFAPIYLSVSVMNSLSPPSSTRTETCGACPCSLNLRKSTSLKNSFAHLIVWRIMMGTSTWCIMKARVVAQRMTFSEPSLKKWVSNLES